MVVADLILELLGNAEINCGKSFPNGRMPILEELEVRLSTKEARISPGAIDNYFGANGDRDRFAALCEEETLLQIYSPYLRGGAYCDRMSDRILEIVLSSATDYTFKSIHRGQSRYDPKTDCFCNEIIITTLSWMLLTEE